MIELEGNVQILEIICNIILSAVLDKCACFATTSLLCWANMHR